jgi:hypothetical protein
MQKAMARLKLSSPADNINQARYDYCDLINDICGLNNPGECRACLLLSD